MHDQALPRQQAIAALAAHVGALAGAIWHQLLVVRMRRRSRRMLARLDDRMLRDVGISQREARIEAAKPFWQA